MRRTLVIAALLLACDEGAGDAAAERDAALADAAARRDAAPPPDAAAESAPCACDAVEDCDACFANIGRCCYDDETVVGARDRLADQCRRSPACAVCCAECAGRTCDALRAAGDCPPMEPAP